MAIQGTADSALDQLAWDRAIQYPLRDELYFDGWARSFTTNQSMPGSTIRYTFAQDLGPKTDVLDEKLDVDGQQLTETHLDMTIHEYGGVVTRTKLLDLTSSIVPVDPDIANRVGRQAGESQDALAAEALALGTNVMYAGTGNAARADVAAGDTLRAANVRRAVAKLRKAKIQTFGGLYLGALDPDVSVDFREETGGAAWVEPHVHSIPQGILNGYVGTFNGVAFMETPRVDSFEGAGTAGADIHVTYILGQEALAKTYPDGVGPRPTFVVSPVVDSLKRFRSVGWHWVGGYKLWRQEALVRIESTSSIVS